MKHPHTIRFTSPTLTTCNFSGTELFQYKNQEGYFLTEPAKTLAERKVQTERELVLSHPDMTVPMMLKVQYGMDPASSGIYIESEFGHGIKDPASVGVGSILLTDENWYPKITRRQQVLVKEVRPGSSRDGSSTLFKFEFIDPKVQQAFRESKMSDEEDYLYHHGHFTKVVRLVPGESNLLERKLEKEFKSKQNFRMYRRSVQSKEMFMTGFGLRILEWANTPSDNETIQFESQKLLEHVAKMGRRDRIMDIDDFGSWLAFQSNGKLDHRKVLNKLTVQTRYPGLITFLFWADRIFIIANLSKVKRLVRSQYSKYLHNQITFAALEAGDNWSDYHPDNFTDADEYLEDYNQELQEFEAVKTGLEKHATFYKLRSIRDNRYTPEVTQINHVLFSYNDKYMVGFPYSKAPGAVNHFSHTHPSFKNFIDNILKLNKVELDDDRLYEPIIEKMMQEASCYRQTLTVFYDWYAEMIIQGHLIDAKPKVETDLVEP